MLDELRKKIYDLLSPVIKTFYMKAPTGEQIPYCVFVFLVIPHSFDTGSEMETVQLQVSIFDNQFARMFNYGESIISVLDNAESTLQLTAFNCISIKRQYRRYEESENIFSSHIIYEIIFNN